MRSSVACCRASRAGSSPTASTMPRQAASPRMAPTFVELCAIDVTLEGFGARCTVVRRNRRGGATESTLGTLTLGVPGRHSVQNALAAVAVGLELDVPFDRIAAALAEFDGAERRFERRGVIDGITVVDDYGHHPTEIAAVLAAARAARPARVVVAFQPHRYTRTRDLMARVRHGAGGRRRSRADRHLRGQRRSDSRHHHRGAGGRGESPAGPRRCTSCPGWTRWPPRWRTSRAPATWCSRSAPDRSAAWRPRLSAELERRHGPKEVP